MIKEISLPLNDKKIKKYSYIKKPLARNGIYSFIIALIVLAATVATIYASARSAGGSPLVSGALGLCCMLYSLLGIFLALLSKKEAERNYILSYIGAAICLLVFLSWLILSAMGYMALNGA